VHATASHFTMVGGIITGTYSSVSSPPRSSVLVAPVRRARGHAPAATSVGRSRQQKQTRRFEAEGKARES